MAFFVFSTICEKHSLLEYKANRPVGERRNTWKRIP